MTDVYTDLIAALKARTGMTVTIDEPRDPLGEWWLDLELEGRRNTVSYRPGVGFGVFTQDEDVYGARPDEIYTDVALAADRIIEIMRPAA